MKFCFPQLDIEKGIKMTTKQNQPIYTGDIAEQHIDPSSEYSRENQEIDFTPEQHAIWSDLFTGIHQSYLMEHLCQEYKEGFALLDLDPKHIPTVAHLNDHITPRTGWHIERTVIRYTLADDWYQKFAQRIFLITDYLRTRDQMEFTPEPDMFHDIFGHLPYLTKDFYARIEDKFAPAYMKATQEEREVIKRLAWYSTEFGLVVQENRFKVFGAGIISGRAEFANAIMEFYRLSRDSVIDYSADVFDQLNNLFQAHKNDIYRIIDGVNDLHRRGQMSSQDAGWNVVQSLYETLGIKREGIFGGEVILAPFDVATIAHIPKTVYAFNPIFFVCNSFEQMDELLDSYLKPIALRN
jgi:phenylalanine-4-hydroxylase